MLKETPSHKGSNIMFNTVRLPASIDQTNALEKLGLNEAVLHEVGMKILAAYSRATPHDAAGAAGLYAYLESVRASRDILKPYGWEPLKEASIELIVNGKLDIRMRPSSGDKFTGEEYQEPRNKNPKGVRTALVVGKNPKQPYLFPEMNEHIPVEMEHTPTWFLFYYIDTESEEMRMELSLPSKYDPEKRVVFGLIERIILEPIKFDGDEIKVDEDFAPEFEFEVKRKVNE